MISNWQTKKLGEVCEFIGGGTPSKANKNYWNGNIPWASIKDIKNQYLAQTQDSITDEGLKNSAANLAFPNDIILATRINPGRPIITKIKTAINQDLKIIKPKIEIENQFLYYLFLTIEKDILKLSNGTTVLGVTLNSLKDFEVKLPNIETQHAIVSKIEELFSELDQGIADLKTAQEQLKVYRQSVLKHAFEGKLTNKNVKEGELPEGWEKLKIGDFAKVKGGKRLPKGHFYSEEQTQYPYIRVTDFCNQTVNKYKLKYLHPETQFAIKNYTISKNDVYISIAGTIGVVGTIPEQLDGANLTENAAKITEFNKVYNKFLSLFLSSIEAQIQIKNKTKITTQPKLSLYRILDIDVPIPLLEEQHLIVQEIESRLSVADKIEESIQESLQKAEALRQSILKKAFSGELV